jgi:hypothetical protein
LIVETGVSGDFTELAFEAKYTTAGKTSIPFQTLTLVLARVGFTHVLAFDDITQRATGTLRASTGEGARTGGPASAAILAGIGVTDIYFQLTEIASETKFAAAKKTTIPLVETDPFVQALVGVAGIHGNFTQGATRSRLALAAETTLSVVGAKSVVEARIR